MEALYHQTNKLIQDVGRELGRLERASEDSAHLVENEIQAQLDHVISNCERLEILVNKEPVTRRPHAKMRVDQLKYDCQHVQAALRNLQHKRYKLFAVLLVFSNLLLNPALIWGKNLSEPKTFYLKLKV